MRTLGQPKVCECFARRNLGTPRYISMLEPVNVDTGSAVCTIEIPTGYAISTPVLSIQPPKRAETRSILPNIERCYVYVRTSCARTVALKSSRGSRMSRVIRIARMRCHENRINGIILFSSFPNIYQYRNKTCPLRSARDTRVENSVYSASSTSSRLASFGTSLPLAALAAAAGPPFFAVSSAWEMEMSAWYILR